jgi:hypothetical protein
MASANRLVSCRKNGTHFVGGINADRRVLFLGRGNFRQFQSKFGRHIFLPAGEIEQADNLPEHIFLGADS